MHTLIFLRMSVESLTQKLEFVSFLVMVKKPKDINCMIISHRRKHNTVLMCVFTKGPKSVQMTHVKITILLKCTDTRDDRYLQ